MTAARAWILVLVSSALAKAACEPHPLAAVWSHLEATHPALAATRQRETAREEAVAQTRASLLPRLDATGSWQYVSEVPTLELSLPSPVPGARPLTMERELGDHDRIEAGLTASWVLFSGFSSRHARAREVRALEATRHEGRQVRSMLALQMGLVDLGLRIQAVELRLRRDRVQAKASWMAAWQAREKGGTSTRAQSLQAKAELLRAVADTLATRRVVDSLAAEFRALAGIAWPGSLADSLDVGFCPESVPAEPDESWLARALKEQAGSIQEARGAATSGRWPVVAAQAGVRTGDPGVNQFGEGWTTWGVAGVQAQWNLFDGFERSASSRRLLAESRALELEAARTTLQRDTQWALLRDERDRIAGERDALSAALEAATEARQAVAGAVASGASQPDDLLDATLRESELRARLSQLSLREAGLALRLRSLSGEPLSFEGRP